MIPNAKVYHITNIPLSGASPLDFFVPRSNNFITIKNSLSPNSASYPLYLAFDSNSFDSGDYIELDNNESYTAQSWGHFYLMSSAYTTSVADIILSKGGDQQEIQEIGEDPFTSFIYTGPGTAMFTSSATAGAKYQIDWGDGTVENLTANGSSIALNHTYGAGAFLARFKYFNPSAVTYLDFRNNNFSGSVPDVSRFPNLLQFYMSTNKLTGSIPDLGSRVTEFYCSSNQLSGQIPNLSRNINLKWFSCRTNQLTGQIPDLSSNVNLEVFLCNTNQLTGQIPNLSNNAKLIQFAANSNQLTGYTPSILPVTLTYFAVNINNLTKEAVDQILTDFTTNAANRPNSGMINVGGTGNATPTPAVKAACEAALKTAPKKWTITTN